ncbi:hypothetical protein SAV14893_078040 [Streptomyces avermitilis]|uniref:Uncharacterized protein n=1 Tax=Streptomyces avermitilis TaxID=33903 RepID=A0A4D4MH73_STRAX|nr:hypothetical protein SAV14893_078040 [Streptomyces avermitilis]GDY71216.1 hypothetical protein SAV31267_007010 [Streptomyces avermitilis]
MFRRVTARRAVGAGPERRLLPSGQHWTGQTTHKARQPGRDRAYRNGPCREHLRRRGIRHAMPEKTDSQAARLRMGSRGGWAPGFDEERYKKRQHPRAGDQQAQAVPGPGPSL